EEEIKACDFFVLVVTKNVLKKIINMEDGRSEDNYVIRVEYPLAQKYHKPIIPIMVDSVDRDALLECFKNIEDTISCGKKYELEQRIKSLGIDLKKGDSSFSQYLKATAFINGIFTETDVKRGIKLLKQAADKGQKEAIANELKLKHPLVFAIIFNDFDRKNFNNERRYLI
ncbi:MAG: toll/interleukin-1 receptor domain-containing protein, partial [Lachnospiraceae bacterium]|nr:toll/interleukin-1 receptor domain-containing protein [Lachnospiraceae bacterium]